ncbi:MAG: sigma-54-dependent Fis family transcriptional regulator [Rickettsiales bacterium]|nr:sigma-54-dependent Fis family transcriptional regulator [Rickettsiales bacterium]
MYGTTVLIIDDEEDICTLISDILQDEGFCCSSAKNSDEALEKISKLSPNLILLDIWLQNSNLDGLGILELVKRKYPLIPVIMISGHGTIEIAVNSIKMGAYDYIEKPFTSSKLLVTVKRAAETLILKKENAELKKKITKKAELIGNSQPIVSLKSTINKVANTASKILIEGEFGAGKELVARTIHKQSNRRAPFIKINSSVLLHEKATQEVFSDTNNGLNLLELLRNGTLFISEIGLLPLNLQHKILKLLKKHSSKRESNMDVRIIGSSSIDLKKEVKKGNFLQDLYYRLSAVQITAPSLRERKDDICALCTYFISYFAKNSNLRKITISEDVMEKFRSYEWPGNVKQFKNTLEWLMILAKIQGKTTVTTSMLPLYFLNKIRSTVLQMDAEIMSIPLKKAREMFERRYLQEQMNRFGNNISRASNFIGMERSALHRKLKLLNVNTYEGTNSIIKEPIEPVVKVKEPA